MTTFKCGFCKAKYGRSTEAETCACKKRAEYDERVSTIPNPVPAPAGGPQ